MTGRQQHTRWKHAQQAAQSNRPVVQILLLVQLVAEGTLHGSRVVSAAQAEVLAMHHTAVSHLRELELMEAGTASRMMLERQLRQNLQEDARQAMGGGHPPPYILRTDSVGFRPILSVSCIP